MSGPTAASTPGARIRTRRCEPWPTGPVTALRAAGPTVFAGVALNSWDALSTIEALNVSDGRPPSWSPQYPDVDWPHPDLASAYADCNGGWTVDGGDVVAIIRNWGARRGQPPFPTSRLRTHSLAAASCTDLPCAS